MQQWPNFGAVQEYWLDAWQRSILFLDILRQRGNIYLEQIAKEVPHVLELPGRTGAGRPHLGRGR